MRYRRQCDHRKNGIFCFSFAPLISLSLLYFYERKVWNWFSYFTIAPATAVGLTNESAFVSNCAVNDETYFNLIQQIVLRRFKFETKTEKQQKNWNFVWHGNRAVRGFSVIQVFLSARCPIRSLCYMHVQLCELDLSDFFVRFQVKLIVCRNFFFSARLFLAPLCRSLSL